MALLEETYNRLLAARAELDRLRPIAIIDNEGSALNWQCCVVANLEREIIAIKGAPPIAHGPSDCPYA